MKQLKKELVLFFLFLFFYITGGAFGQTGINTKNPNATLDINAGSDEQFAIGVIAPRITGENLKSKDALYGSAQDGAIVYVTEGLTPNSTTSKTANVLGKGYYGFDISKGTAGQWVQMFNNEPQILSGVNSQNAYTGNGITVSSINGNTGSQTIINKNFTLTRKSIVTITFSVPVTDLRTSSGGLLTDGTSKGYGVNLVLSGGNLPANYLFVRQAAAFSNGGNTYSTGVFQVGSARSILLEAGTYTVDMRVFVYANDNGSGVRATFGTSAQTVLDIVSVPMSY